MGKYDISELFEVVKKLRHPEKGCAWVRQQDMQTLAHYTIEEAYEVVHAIESRDDDELCAELGDLLFHVLIYSVLAEERNAFTFKDVSESAVRKLKRRNPHVFSNDANENLTIAEIIEKWNSIKTQERSSEQKPENTKNQFKDIPLEMPALMRAGKILTRLSQVGKGVSLHQSKSELSKELPILLEQLKKDQFSAGSSKLLGSILFHLVNVASDQEIDLESVIRSENNAFIEALHDAAKK